MEEYQLSGSAIENSENFIAIAQCCSENSKEILRIFERASG